MVVPGRATASGHLREDGEVFVGKRCRDAALLDLHESLHRVHDDNPLLLATQLIQQIQELNRDENVHGIIVEVPHFKVVDSRAVLHVVSSVKGQDCMIPPFNDNIPTIQLRTTDHGTLRASWSDGIV